MLELAMICPTETKLMPAHLQVGEGKRPVGPGGPLPLGAVAPASLCAALSQPCAAGSRASSPLVLPRKAGGGLFINSAGSDNPARRVCTRNMYIWMHMHIYI